MLKKSTGIIVLIYGMLLVFLGWLGYEQKGSLMSLIFGSGFGALLVICAIAMIYHKKVGAYVAVVLTLLLTGMFAYRYTVTGFTNPAILCVLSGGMLLYLLALTAKWKR